MEVGAELLIYFQSCTPQAGDRVAICDGSRSPQDLSDSEFISWKFTCGDQQCNEPIQSEVLSFSRVTSSAGVGTYQAYLTRDGPGPTYSSLASSPKFRVVSDAYTDCKE